MEPPRTYVYVDGFNLYYGALKGTPHRWLDLDRLFRLLLPRNDVVRIRYFTALWKPRPNAPTAAAEQRLYLRALATIPTVQVHLGTYLAHARRMPLAAPHGGPLAVAGRTRFVQVWHEVEKGSDVSLASHLVHDAHRGRFDAAVEVSNDSDLAPAIEIVTGELGLPVGWVDPHARRRGAHPSVQLRRLASFTRPLRAPLLAKAQLPPVLRDDAGPIVKPFSW